MEAQFVEESDGLTFWLARPQDYDEVMAISQDIYQGNDYLPHHYHTWMTERDSGHNWQEEQEAGKIGLY